MMTGFLIHTGNRLEILAEALAETIKDPLPSPLAPEIVVVQSRGMARWVSMALAVQNGICANVSFPFPNAFLQAIFRMQFPDLPEQDPFDPDILTLRIMGLIPKYIDHPGFESLGTYLNDDIFGLKRYQLASKIADIFDQYLVFRPEMIFAWEKGRANHWQARLWRALSAETEIPHRAQLRKSFLEKIRSRTVDTTRLPQRISLFGISYLPPFYLQTFAELANLTAVNLFILNPCMAYWADIVSDREIRRIRGKYAASAAEKADLHLERGNRLLASMGSQGRDFLALVSGFNADFMERFQALSGHDLLSCIQWDILNLIDRSPLQHSDDTDDKNGADATEIKPYMPDAPAETDTSVQIHSCHSPMREIEVLHDNLLAMFEEDPELGPADILVMTPDIESYAPYIRAVFEAQTDEALRIPFSIADQSLRKESRVIDGFLNLLELKDSRLGIQQILTLLESPGIMAKFSLTESDIRIIERWIRDTRIRWGLDERTRIEFGLPGFRDNTWRAGLERLLLGYAMPGGNQRMFADILPYDHMEGNDAKILGRFLEFLDRVFALAEILSQPRGLADWSHVLTAMMERFFEAAEETERELQILRDLFATLALEQDISGFNEPLALEVVRGMVSDRLQREHFDTGFISGGVTFCAMLPMRSIPAKVICLIGMNSDAFPRDSRSVGFDFMARYPRMGDRSRRNDDKYLFLEAIISARSKLYISYVGQNIRDNTIIPPSVLVSELMDYITEGFGVTPDQLVRHHKLQAFSPVYFTGDSRLFSYSKANFTAAAGLVGRADPPPFFSEPLPDPPAEWKQVPINALCAFFSHPARFLLQKRLGLYLDDTTPGIAEREHFNLDHLERYLIGQDMVAARISGSDWKEHFRMQKAAGALPVGNVGETLVREMDGEVSAFVRKISGIRSGESVGPLEIDLEIAGFRLFGKISDLFENGMIRCRYAKTRAGDRLSTWIGHLALCASWDGHNSVNSIFAGKDLLLRFYPMPNSRDVLADLLALYWRGLSEPVHFLPNASFIYAWQLLEKGKPPEAALAAAQHRWVGSDFSTSERDDPYNDLCFRYTDPLDEAFKEMAEAVYTPLMDHCQETEFFR